MLADESLLKMLLQAAEEVWQRLRDEHTLLIAGNGGSAADAQHFAAELVGRFNVNRRPFAAIALTTDTSFLTAWSNDMSYDDIFARQVEALGKKGDVFVAISTSGNSPNLLRALDDARRRGIYTISLLGKGGGAMKEKSDIALVVPSDSTPRIQEVHITCIHALCQYIEDSFHDHA